MWFGVISLFPEMLQALHVGIIGRAIKKQSIIIEHWNPRLFTSDKHQCVDDRPYGGGPGMVMMAEPLQAALQAAKKAAPAKPTTIFLSPQGKLFDQQAAATLATKKAIILLAGRYEGIDERIIEQEVDEEWSIGDYVISGGELAAMVMMDAITRLLPGVVGDNHSVTEDSLATGLLKYPQYTRPESFSTPVPEVLLSGHHKQIERWRIKQSLGKTWLKRPDLLAKKQLTEDEQVLLAEFMKEHS